MPILTVSIILMFLGSAVLQLIGLISLPMTKGFTEPGATLVCILAFVSGLYLMASLIHRGADLEILVPFLSSVIPLCALMVGVFYYGQSISFAKLGSLVLACMLVGVAAVL